MKRIIIIASALACASSSFAVDFVSNGAFESGNVLFSSDYSYFAPNMGSLTSASTYTVDNNPVDNHPSWAVFGDHTSSLGLMFLANGAGDASKEVWSQTVSGLSVGATYTFTAYGASVYSTSPATIRLKVNGTTVDTKALDATIGSWGKIEGTWVATTGSATLDIYDLVTAGDGNDFALDDISFVGPVPEPSTLAVLAVAGLGMRLRSKRRTVA